MKNKTLVKTKIVLEDDGKTLVTYFWKKTFLFFGHWYPFGTSTGNKKMNEDKISKINDNSLSKLNYENYILGI